MMEPIIRWTLNDQNMKGWPAGQAQVVQPTLHPQLILQDSSQSCPSLSLPTPSLIFLYKLTFASSCVLEKLLPL